jgi:hypothetical protein
MGDKAKSDRGVRMEESGVDEDIPVGDAAHGDEGIDERVREQPFRPGKPETYGKGDSHVAEDSPSQASTPPGSTSKAGVGAVTAPDPAEGDRVTSVDPKLVDEEVLPAQTKRPYEDERRREERGNRGRDEEPASGQGA